jgi:chromosome segregation ATPase
MEDISLWMLIFAGGAVGLLGVFLAASERELKKTRREVETLVARLGNSPKIVTLDNPVEPQPVDYNAATAAAAKEQELQDRIANLTSELEASRNSVEEFRSQRDLLKSDHVELLELRAINQQLEGEISHLKGELQSAESRVNAARDDGQDAANDRAKLESVIADMQNQLEAHRMRGEELAAARQRLAEYESRETIHIDEQKNAQAQIRGLQQELFAAKEQAQNLHAAHDRVTEMERLYQQAKNEIRHLEEECSRWQERVGGGDDQKRRGALLRQQLDELQSKQAALIERHRQFQNDLTVAIRLLEVPPDGLGEASAPRASSLETEARSTPMWSPTGKPLGRNPEQEPPAKAGARVEGAMADADTDALSNGNGGNHEIHAESASSAISTDMNPMIPAIDPSSTMIAGRRRRRFGIFPA